MFFVKDYSAGTTMLFVDRFIFFCLHNNSFIYTIRIIQQPQRPGVTYCLKFGLLILFFFWSVCLFET